MNIILKYKYNILYSTLYKVDTNHYCSSLAYSYYNYGQVILVLVFFEGEPVSKLADRLTVNLEVF